MLPPLDYDISWDLRISNIEICYWNLLSHYYQFLLEEGSIFNVNFNYRTGKKIIAVLIITNIFAGWIIYFVVKCVTELHSARTYRRFDPSRSSPGSHQRCPVSIACQCMWDLCCMKFLWDTFFYQNFWFHLPVSLIIHLPLIYHWLYNIIFIGGCVVLKQT
jgi:hypothetical protein